jgi:hypothetical protein
MVSLVKRFSFVAATAVALGVAACAPPQAKAPESAAEATCKDDGERLSGTGICLSRVANLFRPERLSSLTFRHDELPEGCNWAFNETMMPDPNEAILYLALSCRGKTTKLEFSAGARSASLDYGVSGSFENVPAQGEEGSERVRLFPLEGSSDPKAMILAMAKDRATEEGVGVTEVAACELRAAGEDRPADAYVVDVNDAYKKANRLGPFDDGPKDATTLGAYSACGSFGITNASGDFWMIRDGYAWFVSQGQDVADFDAGSLTLFRKSADGAWGATR